MGQTMGQQDNGMGPGQIHRTGQQDNGTTYTTKPKCSPADKKLSLTIVNLYIALHHKSEKKGPRDWTAGPKTEQDGGTGQWDHLYNQT